MSIAAHKLLSRSLESCWAHAKSGAPIPNSQIKELFELYRSTATLRPLYTHALIKLLPHAQRQTRVQLCNQLIRFLVDENRPEESLGFLKTVQLASGGAFKVEYETLEKLLLSAKYYNDVEFAWQTVRSIQTQYGKLYSRTWGFFVNLVLEQSHYQGLLFCWKEAAVPGYVVLDDHSYTQMARIAALNGNIEMCNWAIIGLQERNRFFGIDVPHAGVLRAYSVEAAATHSLQNGFKSSFKTACRLLQTAEDLAGEIHCYQLPRFLEAQQQQFHITLKVYNELLHSVSAHELVKTLFFNLVLKHHVARQNYEQALEHYHEASEEMVSYNEESVLTLLEVARMIQDASFARHVASLHDSQRVQRSSAWARF